MTDLEAQLTATIPAPGELEPPTGLQVWWARVDVGQFGPELRRELSANLNPATLTRLERYVRVQDRDRGLAAHALLRRLLAAVVGGRPADLVIQTHCPSCGTSEHGKPYLAGSVDGRTPPVEVNLSHSGQAVAVALAPSGTQVGIDVEERRTIDWATLRRSVFADQEWVASEAAADPARHRTLAWARKEASAKVSGHGLSLPFAEVVISDAEWGGWTGTLPGAVSPTAGWDLNLYSDVAAAVAVQAADRPALPGLPLVRQVTIRD